jgi:hypothetical protein
MKVLLSLAVVFAMIASIGCNDSKSSGSKPSASAPKP